MVPREYTNNAYAKFWGTTKSIMGFFFRNGLLNFILKQTLKNMLIGHDSENAL